MEEELFRKCIIYEKQLIEYRKKLLKSNNPNEEMKEVYLFIRSITKDFYINGQTNHMYNRILDRMFDCEKSIRNGFIIESNPAYNPEAFVTNEDGTWILDSIVYKIRGFLLRYHTLIRKPNINKLTFTNDCAIASEEIKKYCDQLNFESYIVQIHPGYSKIDAIYAGSGYHFFNIIKLNNKYYLIDPIYRQFFTTKNNYLERLGIVGIANCKPGKFMLMNELRQNLAQRLFAFRWIELNEDIFNAYLDGFAISYRNGLYYEQTQDYSYETTYTVDDYIRFLRGEDNQVNHEGIEVLGYQKKPLNNNIN